MGSVLTFRRERIDQVVGGKFQPQPSATVVVYRAGAQANGNQTNTSITVNAGHGFAAAGGVKTILMRYSGGAWAMVANSYRTVNSASATNVILASSLTVLDGDYLVNLGNDGGSSSPNYTASPALIYGNSGGVGSAVSQARLTPNAQGEYSYWTAEFNVWELVLLGTTPSELSTYFPLSSPWIQTMGDAEPGVGSQQIILNPTGQQLPGFFVQNTVPAPTISNIVLNRSSSGTQPSEIAWARDKNQIFALGVDTAAGVRRYLAFWADKANKVAGAWQSGDFFSMAPAGMDTNGLDGPKFHFNGAFSDQASFDQGYQYQFFLPSLRSSGTGRRAFWVGYEAAAVASGGISIETGGGNIPLTLYVNHPSNRYSSIQLGKATGLKLFEIGLDLGQNDTQNFGIYDVLGGGCRLYIAADGSLMHTNALGLTPPVYFQDVLYQAATVTGAINAEALRYKNTSGTPAANLAIYKYFGLPDAAGTEYRAGAIGVRMTDASAGNAKSNLELWSSYGPAAIMSLTHTRRVGINCDPTTAFMVGLNADGNAAASLVASTTRPPDPSASSECSLFIKGGKLYIVYNDAATVRYKSLDLTGTGVTWVHTTTPP